MLAVMLLPSYSLGDTLWKGIRRLLRRPADASAEEAVRSQKRRELLMSLSSLPVIGAFGYAFFRKHVPRSGSARTSRTGGRRRRTRSQRNRESRSSSRISKTSRSRSTVREDQKPEAQPQWCWAET
jgi:hypothetical protein